MLLKNTLKNWLVPPGCWELLKKFKIPDNIVSQTSLEITKFKNKHKGQRCFILASGPSIKTQDLKGLANELCIAVSHFSLHEDIGIIKPRYHVLAPSHHPFCFADTRKFFETFNENYSWDFSCFLGHRDYEFSYKELFRAYPELAPHDYYYIDYGHSPELDDTNKDSPEMWNPCGTPFAVRTVIYEAILLASYMGVKEIYLLGCDHDYLQDITRTTNHHFYKEEQGISDKAHLDSFSRERWFLEYYLRWKQYRLMGEHLEQCGCSVFNATHGGMLDVFPRVKLEDVLCRKS